MGVLDRGMLNVMHTDVGQESLRDDKCEGKSVTGACCCVVLSRQAGRVDRLDQLQEDMFASRSACCWRRCSNFLDIRCCLALECDHDVIKMSISFEGHYHFSFDCIMCGVTVDETRHVILRF